MSQAAYHGVPIIALPFFGDQPGNADKAVAKVTSLSATEKCWHAELSEFRLWISVSLSAMMSFILLRSQENCTVHGGCCKAMRP